MDQIRHFQTVFIEEKMMEPLVGDLVYGEGGAVRSLRRGEERDTPMWAVLMPVPGYDVQMPETQL